MKRLLATITLAVSMLAAAFAQQGPIAPGPVGGPARRIIAGGTLPATCAVGDVYVKTGAGAGLYSCTAANTWVGTTSFGPVDATYITQTANGTLTNEQAMGLLATGIVKNATTTGIQSIAAAGTDYVAPDAELTALAGLTSAADKLPYFTGSGTAAVADFSSFARTFVDDANAAAVQTTLGVLIGTNVQAYDADLTTYAGITPSANVQSLLAAADYAAMKTILSLVIGTNVQAYDADLTTYASITPSANVQSLLGAANYAAMKTQLALTIGTDVQAYDADLTTFAGITPGTGVATALGVNVGSAGALVTFNGAGGTPSSLTGTNISGTAASLTAGLATALAANGSNCSAGNFPLGVDASGASESCGTNLASGATVNSVAIVDLSSSQALTNKTYNGLTVTSSTGTVTVTNAKTFTLLKTMSLTAADDTGVYTLPTGTKTLLATDGSAASLTGLPISTGVSGLGTGVATVLATPSSANLRAALTDESGTGAALFANGALGDATFTTITNSSSGTVPVVVSGSQATSIAPTFTNTNSAGTVEFDFVNDGGKTGVFGIRGSTRTAYGTLVASEGFLYTNGAGLTLMSDAVAGYVKIATGGNTLRWQFDSSGHFIAGTDKAVNIGDATHRPGDIYVGNVLSCNDATHQLGSDANGKIVCDTALSDSRLKRDWKALVPDESLASVLALSPGEFYWTEEEKSKTRQYGLLADDVESVIPDLVGHDPEGPLTPKLTRLLDYRGLIPFVISGEQALYSEIQALKARVAVLEAKQ